MVACLFLFTVGCGMDIEQAHLCERVIGAFEPAYDRIEVIHREKPQDADYQVKITYRAPESTGEASDHWVTCGFGGGHFDRDRLELVAVATDREGVLSGMELFWLKRWLNIEWPLAPAAPEAQSAQDGRPDVLYFLQQTINALTLSCIYGLLAISFTVVYGIIGKINFAFGEIYMIGAVITALWITIFGILGVFGLALAMVSVFTVAVVSAAAYGWTTERVVLRPLRASTSHAPLIATIGLSMFLQEYVRLLHGARDFWIPPDFSEGLVLAQSSGFTLYASLPQIRIIALTVAVYWGLVFLLERTALGRAHRACSDDMAMAALLGVSVDRTVALTFVVGAACAGIAGFVIVMYYGVANFFMGFVIGFKALTAAIVGGIGSVRGAMLGGIVIALLETYWAAYLAVAYKDIAVFALLALVLIYRPAGLLGQARLRED